MTFLIENKKEEEEVMGGTQSPEMMTLTIAAVMFTIWALWLTCFGGDDDDDR